MAAAILCLTASTAVAQVPFTVSHLTAPNGYTLHESIDLGGRVADIYGSDAMYDTLVNQQSGPRIMGETFELNALPGSEKTTFVDHLKAFTSGLGGEPNNLAKLDFSKGKLYDFSGLFRRDRQYFDYNLLGNPNIPAGQSIPIAGGGSYAWPSMSDSPFLFNTVRRMTDTKLTLLPLSKVTFHVGYSQNVFQGPSMTPSGYQVAGSYSLLLEEYQRNSTDDWTTSVDWKPVPRTKLTYEEQITHYKGDSYFTMAPQYFNLQEANGSRVALLQNFANPIQGALGPVGCAAGVSPITAASSPNGLPIVDPSCGVISSYSRTQPTRVLFPTEIIRLQSSSIKNVTMNGNVRYTDANMNLPNYYDSFQGLAGTSRQLTYVGYANAKREAIAADYGVTWQVLRKVSISDQVDFSNVHQPGVADITSATTVSTPTGGNINSTALTTTVINTAINPATGKATSTFEGSPSVATPNFDYFGQKFITNNVTAAYDATDRTTFTLTYHYQQHTIGEGAANNVGYTSGISNFTINENGGIFGVAVRPTNNWIVNGSAEVLYADNVFTPVAPRQLQHYRVHTTYRPKTWATISAAYNDLERHNNTNNTGVASVDGPLDHVDHSRTASVNAALMPSEHYGFDISYAYSDVYAATNICYLGSGSATIPGAASANGVACPSPAPRTAGSSYNFFARDFMNAPTQFASVALALSPVDKFHANIGYRLSSVNGTRFFNDPRDVNGSLVSTYQSPFVNVSYAMQKNLVWKGEYDYFGYGEGSGGGAQYCNTSSALPSTTTAAPVVACSTLPNTTASGAYATSARNFHANNVTVGLHYAF